MKKNLFQTLNFIWIALMAAPFVFTIVILTVLKPEEFTAMRSTGYVMLGISLLLHVVRRILYTLLIRKLQDKTFSEKLFGYQSASIVKAAILEGATFLMLFAYLFTGMIEVLIGVGLYWLIMILEKPSKEKFKREVSLTREEQIEVDNM